MVRYVYDAWGNHAVLGTDGNDISDPNHIGILNPFRYRGYFYDEETGLYYLKTRYYDPETGRFITIDGVSYLDPETINGLNLYAYCGNNPVMYTDPNGTDWNSFWTDVGSWFVRVGNSIGNFFTKTIPDWWNGSVVPWWNKIKMEIGRWTWEEIINPMWDFTSQTAWDWIENNWKNIVDAGAGALSIGSGILGILTAAGVVSVPVVGQIILGIVGIASGIYSIGSSFNWW